MPNAQVLFLSRWLRNPLGMGAIAPSGRSLALAMASLVPADPRWPVIELGGGTGSVTRALLETGVAPSRLVVVERDRRLSQRLGEKFPDVTTLCGDAGRLDELLRPLGIDRAGAVVSSLPLISMRRADEHRAIEQSLALLGPGAPLVQFTYGLSSPISSDRYGVTGELKFRVLDNLPPAGVWLYHRREQNAAAG